MNNSAAVAALSALAQASRLAIFRALVEAGPSGMSAGLIGEATGISPSSLSFHLKELTHAEMASARHEGRFVIYSANFDTMNSLLGFLAQNCCGGNPCMPNDTATRPGRHRRSVNEVTASDQRKPAKARIP